MTAQGRRQRVVAKMLAIMVLVIGGASCASDDWSLLVADSPDDPRFRDLRARLDVRVEPGTAPLPEDCDAERGTCGVNVFVESVMGGCAGGIPGANTMSECESRAEMVNWYLCVSETLMTVVESVTQQEIPIGSGTLLVPPQDAESQAELARTSATYAFVASTIASYALTVDASCSDVKFDEPAADVSAPSSSPLNDMTSGQHVASLFRRAYQLFLESSTRAAERSTAAADAQRSRATDQARAELQEIAPYASRAAAAHALIGGAHGMQALRHVDSSGMFPRPRLTAAGQLALALLRTSALDPSVVLDIEGQTIDAMMFNHSSANAMVNSVAGRLALLLPDASLLTVGSADEAYARIGLSRAAFVEAREYLATEVYAFDRSTNHRIPAESLSGAAVSGDTTSSFTIPLSDAAGNLVPFGGTAAASISLFAATRLEPHQPPASWWSAAIRYEPSPAVLSGYSSASAGPDWEWGGYSVLAGLTYGDRYSMGDGNVYLTGDYSGYSAAGVAEWVAVNAQRAVARIDDFPSPVSAAARDAQDTIAAVLGDIGQSDLTNTAATAPVGRARACVLAVGDTSKVDVRLDLEIPGLDGDDLLVLNTHEALECATDGTIEGAPCTSADIVPGVVATATWSADAVVPGSLTTKHEVALTEWDAQHFPGSVVTSGRPNADVRSVFVVRLRTQGTTLTPGAYRPLVSWMLPRPTDNLGLTEYISCEAAVVAPGLDARARDMVAPSPEYPGDSEVSCAGVHADMRLPLENELTDDFNGVEDSWRHYLLLAQQAADQADMLGETLIQEGLEMDLRAESAVDQLQSICGVGVDVSPFQTPSSTHDAEMDGSCPPGYYHHVGSSGSCALDPVQYAVAHAGDYANQALLANCLGDLSDDDGYVALGDRSVCLWAYEGTVCGPDPSRPTLPCVYPANADGTCEETSSPPADYPAGAVLMPVPTSLGLFQVPEDLPTPSTPPDPQSFPCAALAQLRAVPSGTPMSTADRRLVFRNAFFTNGGFGEVGSRLRWRARAGDVGQVTLGNTVIFATAGSHWPMVDASEDLRPECGASPCWDDSAITTAAGASAALATYRRPLFAIRGLGSLANGTSDNSRQLRARLNDLMARAVIAANIMGGGSLRGSRFPYYHDAGCHLYFHGGNFALQANGIYQSEEGSLFVNECINGGDSGTDFALSDLSAVAQADGSTVDWTHCFYDGSCVGTFQASGGLLGTGESAHDLPFEMPMLVMNFGASVERPNVDALTAALWGEGLTHGSFGDSFVGGMLYSLGRGEQPSATGMRMLLTPDGPLRLRDFTNYFAASRDEGGGFDGTAESNIAFVEAPGHGLSQVDFLNGLELACLAASVDAGHPNPITYGCDETMPFETVGDVLDSTGYLDCIADRAGRSAGLSVLRGLPPSVADAVTQGGPSVGGSLGGAYGEQIAEIQAALLQLRDEQAGIADDIRRYSDEVEIARNTLRHYEIASELQDLQLDSTAMNEITSCIVSVAHIAEATASGGVEGGVSAAGASIGSAATCANSILQTAIAQRMRALEGQDGALSIQSAFADADLQFVSTSTSIRGHAVAIQAAIARIQGALGQLHTLQAQARTALSRALFLDSSVTGTSLAVDTVQHRRYNTTLTRYQDAHARAIRLAYIARIALEQRLAVHLSDMHDDLISVSAPAHWADELCTLSSLDYETVRNSAASLSVESPDNYAGYYVGDYVRRLEQVFESYSFAHPFHEGTDMVVLSLRDDVFRVRRACEQEVPNLLYQSGALDVRASSDAPGWSPVGCDLEGSYLPTDVCTSVLRDSETAPPVISGDALGPPAPTRVSFGARAGADTRYSQVVDVAAGRYRLSWFAQVAVDVAAEYRIAPADAVRALVPSTGAAFVMLNAGEVPAAHASAGTAWTRYDYFFDVASSGPVEVAVLPKAETNGAAVLVAGVQLTVAGAAFGGDVNAVIPDGNASTIATRFDPGSFFNTDATRTQRVEGCADDGTEFRRTAFGQVCETVCPDGYGGTCDPALASRRCAWQTSLNVSSDALGRLLVGSSAGFAGGNYNYRMESAAVNLVGTGLRECGSTSTTGCYTSGNFAYSLVHHGPFLVRDFEGAPYFAPLFTGRIENARALAAERYISNPISGADQALLQPYVRTEFAGRPLGGTMVLRIWDDDTLAFNRLEDIQLVLTYRYWQHQR